MSLTSCIKELGSALDPRDKKIVLDGTIKERKTTPDQDAAAIKVAEPHLAQLEAALEKSEAADKAPAPTPAPAPAPAIAQTAAQRNATRRETERSIFNDLIKHHVGGPLAAMDVLEREIRARAGDVQLSNDQVKKLATAIRKKVTDDLKAAALAEHRNPAVLQAAMKNASAGPLEHQGAFMAGFQHAMAGKTKSTLTGDNLAERQKGYAAAMRWRATEEGAAWFEGRPVNKLQNTGLDLRRHWEALREQMKASESDVKKAWRQIERATTRADLFAPYTAKEGATPGYKAYAEAVRDGTVPFKEWLVERYTDWSGEYAFSRHRKDGDPTNIDLIVDGDRYPSFIQRTGESGRNYATVDEDARVKFRQDAAFRAQWLRDAANTYIDQLREFTSFLQDATTAKDAAAAFAAKYGDDKADRTDLTPHSIYKHLNQAGQKHTGNDSASMWANRRSFTLMQLLPYARDTKHLIANENNLQLADKTKPLTPPRLDSVKREGMPDRRNGENVTPQKFKETFGFADVGFGKWVGAQQDQDHLNYSFDAFADLAHLWHADPKVMGFAGRLHFTIGALGHGKFAAHFHPAHPSPEGTVQVINVTNTRGDGTVGHEWTHALDHNLGGQWKRVRALVLQILRHGVPTAKSVEDEAKKFLVGGWFWRGDKKLSKVQAAMRGIQYFSGSRVGTTAYNANAEKLGKDYWANDEEMIARASEAWLGDTLGANSNTYLVQPAWSGDGAVTKERGYRGTPYPSGHERKTFNKVFAALAKAIQWNDGKPTVTYDDFRRELGEEFFDWEKRRDSLQSLEAMTAFQQQLVDEQQTARANAEAATNKIAEAKARELEEAAREEEPVLDAPGAAESSGALSDADLEDLFDEAAAELREGIQEQPLREPPPDAQSEPEREQPAESRKKDNAPDEREAARRIGDLVLRGVPVVFSASEWATSRGLPTIHDFPSDKVRHIGFGVFEYRDANMTLSWTAGGAMESGGPEGTSYTTVSAEKGEWDAYPKQKVLDALEAFINDKPAAAPQPAPAADKTASTLLAEAAKLGVKGANEALTGLAKLFGAGPGKLSSFPAGLDEETYAKAKPHFQAALAAFQEAGKTLKDLFKLLIAQFGDGIKPYAIRFAKEQELTASLGTMAPKDSESPSLKMAFVIRQQLAAGVTVGWRDLFELGDKYFGGTQAEGKYTPKDAYDALEVGVNLYLQTQQGRAFNPADKAAASMTITALERVMQLLPTQSKRTSEQQDMQQFSTVPPLAYAAAWAANITGADTVLEPSAGVGGLAVFAKNAGARLVLNELSSRRAALLGELFPTAKVWTENAEQLDNILPPEIQPTVVLMNPPFSNSSATNIKKDTMIGARHVEQALARLAPGGRLVAIVGEGMARGKPAFKDWWAKIDAKYSVRAAIPADGSGYAKYGTSFDNVLLVIDKARPRAGLAAPITTKVSKYSELVPLLQEIRDDRPDVQAPGNDHDSVERDTAERARDAAVQASERDTGAGPGAGGAAVVGGRESPGAGRRAGDRSGGGGGRTGGSESDERSPGGRRTARGDDAGGRSEDAGAAAPAVTSGEEQTHTEAITASVFEPYRPQRLEVSGAKEHPGKLVQSAAMATVQPPRPDYSPNLPPKTITEGKVSIAQLEAVIYAGQAHKELLPSGERKGYFIGDGTGVGKGREIGAIILDNIRQGRKKHVWVSEKQGLINDARRDFKGVGGDEDLIFNQNETLAEGKIDAKGGVLFTTYSTLRSGANSQALNPKPLNDKQLLEAFPAGSKVVVKVSQAGSREFSLHPEGFNLKNKKVYIQTDAGRRFVSPEFVTEIDGVADWKMGKPKKKAGQSRLDQLVTWLGKDFDGVLVFDEAHNAGNAVAMKGDRGYTDPSLQALSVVEIQKQLPQARVVYVSATGATQVSNLSFATRLGLWGPGTPFADVNAFIDQMTAGGLATMELVARDMKQLGLYVARSLSYEGVTYSRVEHELTPAQTAIYNRLADAWQIVLANFNEALELTDAGKDGRRKSAVLSAFWSGQQRFFNQVITSMQMPSVLEDAERELAAGNALVMQLVNTNEAAQERSLAKRKDDEDSTELEELDLTPRDQLLQMVEKAFPVQQFEEFKDDEGKRHVRPSVDSKGNPIENKGAVAMREKLLQDLRDIAVPDGPLEQLINHFGPAVVAEITGRGRRVVAGRWNTKEKGKAFIEPRGGSAIRADAASFMADKKRILVFSDAGGTGFSFHADLTAKNQRKRIHYLLQPGWRADKAVQGFGRTHRTNEASEPHYKLASTNIPAHKRFLSAIARRLDQLGALTKGQRDTANQGLFSEKDNLEGVYAQQAVRQFLDDVLGTSGRSGGSEIDGHELLAQMGLSGIIDPETNRISESKYPETRQFLNRMLSLTLDMQGQVFDHFIGVMEQKVEIAVQRGEFDAGLQTIQALSAHVLRDEVVYTEPKSGAETRYVELELTQPTYFRSFPEAGPRRPVTYYRNEKSGRVWAHTSTYKMTEKSGAIVEEAQLSGTGGYQSKPLGELSGRTWKKIDAQEARDLWKAENEKRPKTYTERAHMIVGAMLPIWDRLQGEGYGRINVVRTQTDDGRRYLGRQIAEADLKTVLKRLNVESATSRMKPAEILAAVLRGDTGELANGWELRRSIVSGDPRVELITGYIPAAAMRELTGQGVMHEQIQWKDRLFIPTGRDGAGVLQKVLANRPLVELTSKAKASDDEAPVFARREGGAKSAGAFGLQRRSMIQMAVDQMTAGWKRKPKVHVLASMADAPEGAHEEMRRQQGQNAAGETAGFLLDGDIYLVANQLGDRDDIREVLYHEALGHYGLRGVFGDGLVPILQQLATMRPQLIAKKAREYGLDLSKEEDRLLAAEEVLAEMAQTRPEIGWVQRTIALIRRALRAIGVVKGLSDNDIVANYILPARGFVERGRAAATGGPVAFSRGFNTREIQVDGKWRPIVDAKGRVLAQGDFDKQQAFWRWFGDSKVVDEAGRPRPVYHGTDTIFEKFDSRETVGWFSEEPLFASQYAAERRSGVDGENEDESRPTVLPVYLSIQNPLRLEFDMNDDASVAHDMAGKLGAGRMDFGGEDKAWEVVNHYRFMELVVAAGYDGVQVRERGSLTWAPVKPEQVKSTTGNRGTFDSDNPDVRFSRKKDAGDKPRVTPLQRRNAEQRLAALGYKVEQGYEDEPAWIEHQDGTQYDWNDQAGRFEDEDGNALPQEAAEIAQYIGNVADEIEDPEAAGGAANDRNADPFKPGHGSRPVFARTTTIGATRAYSPAQERAMRNVGFQVQQPTLRERAEALWKDAGKKLAQGIADQFRPIKDLSTEAYALLRLSKGASGAFETILHGGRLKLTDGVYDFDAAGRGGVVKSLLIPLQGEHHDFFRWIAANRAERLKAEERENLFSAQDIADLKTLSDGQLQFDFKLKNGPRAGQVTRSRAEAYADSLVTFNSFNKNVMDMAEQSGLIDPEARKLWEHEFYIPFYRVSEDFEGGFRGANIKTGVVRQKAFEKLKGGKEKLNADLLDNTLLNWAHLLDAAAKNRAAKATLEAAQAAGIAIEAKEHLARQIGSATGNRQGVVWFMDSGLQRYFVVDDHHVLAAITSLEYAGMRSPVMDAMGAFKHALTVGVTASPFFKVRNLIRDSVTVLGTSRIDLNVAKNLAQGWKDTDPKNDRYFQLLAGGGTIHFGTMLEGSEAKRVQALVESGVDQATILNSADKVQAFYRKYIEPTLTAYNELGNRGEAINRAALYDQLRKAGKSHAEASLAARDLMDFSMQGTFTSIRFLTQVVPFFNARIQGLYKLGRSAQEDPARFGMVVGTTALVSLALLAAYGGDDDWKRREEWDRDNFWWFKFGGIAFRIPKPFEIGAMATLAERGAELMFDDEMTGARFRKAVLKIASDQLSMNPVPQLIKPIVDVYANFDSFTDRPIETMDMERLAPEFRFTERTSMVARGASTALNAAAGAIGGQSLSPVQIDHLLRGYFGWLGAFIVGAGDTVFRPMTGQPRQAAPDYWKSLTGGMVAELEGAPSRYVSQMYEQAKEIEQAYGTWRMLLKQGKGEEAAEYRTEHQDLLAKHRGIERIKRQEGELNQRIREIERSDMDPIAKRERIQQVRDQQDRLARVLSPGAR